ncbi:agmatinase [Candidatus Pacearchaeota archaeon CG_4_9_14_3_um_filter_31_7]|nr:MAG: agmatinase [Candidatus Pacearchaeota archaeon CG1_02_31_27]PIN92632.1 MAG: agmatinase [Candidatus Pacearchaeota archaeon CG10_big_fil_rev_8_21_14_0_10_31_59]PIZ81184.1 MAG: agmatinase [Candidatus Pacearchaeota archaeon CG_4_10_14_0_2_um_filter_31_10]PJA70927.1 MAG: agmatinase [Candidatus Pacearchaeota archaeon CG_4_9_14_3_um_filter_31_7]
MKNETFLGFPNSEFEKASLVVLPVAFDSTSTWKKGSSKGPEAIIESSREIELYDLDLNYNPVEKMNIFTLPILKPKNIEEMQKKVKEGAKKVIDGEKFLIMIGGEHSITLPAVEIFAEKYSDLTVLQLDAHADLYDEFENQKYGHMNVMKRIKEKNINVVQAGIRCISQDEIDDVKKNNYKNIFYKKLDKKAIKLCKKNVYLSIDLDILDPSIMPSVGTPEPDGILWKELMQFLTRLFKEKNVIGVDVVELCPIKDLHHADFTAAKLIYKIIGMKFK